MFHLRLVSSNVHYSAVKGTRNSDRAHQNIATATGIEIQCSSVCVCLCQATSLTRFCTRSFTLRFLPSLPQMSQHLPLLEGPKISRNVQQGNAFLLGPVRKKKKKIKKLQMIILYLCSEQDHFFPGSLFNVVPFSNMFY